MSTIKGFAIFVALVTVAPFTLVALVVGIFGMAPFLKDGAGPLPWPPTSSNLLAMAPYHRSAGTKVPIAPVREVHHVKNEDGNSTVLAYRLLSTNWSRIGSFTDLDGNKADVEEGRIWTNVCASFFYQNEFYRFIIKSNKGPVIGERRVATFINVTNVVNPWQWLTNYMPSPMPVWTNVIPWTNGVYFLTNEYLYSPSNYLGGITCITNAVIENLSVTNFTDPDLKSLLEWWRSCHTNDSINRALKLLVPEGKNAMLLEDEK